MARPPINHTKLNNTLSISECHATADYPYGFWLYDHYQGMNLAMASPTRDDTFVKAITYYQNRLKDVSKEYIELQKKVDSFISQFPKED